VDQTLPSTLESFLNISFIFLATFVLLCVLSPIHLIIILIFILASKKSTSIYVSVNTELKRLDQIARSPLISTIGEMINGSVTVKQYKKKDWMKQKFIRNLDMYTVTHGHLMLAYSYLRVRIKYLLFFVVAFSIGVLYVDKGYKIILVEDE
jgi:ATP-binding cassette subfamily C (CFTR/MRP) protein 10